MFRCFFSDFLFVLFSFWEFTHAWNAPRVDAVDGSWSMWSAWSQCSVTCGQGERKRFRSCSNPAPNFGGRWCSGLNQQFGECAAPLECPVNGAWSEWGLWTACSVSCGQGTRHRYRACDNPLPQVGGRPCRGNSQETDDCALVKECPRDGHWSSWSKWSMCSVTCGGDGTRLRYRSCNNPPPSGEGVECPGPNRGVRQCAAGQECPDQRRRKADVAEDFAQDVVYNAGTTETRERQLSGTELALKYVASIMLQWPLKKQKEIVSQMIKRVQQIDKSIIMK